MSETVCLSDPACGVCHTRQLEQDPRGWLPHPGSDAARQRLLAEARAEP
jgi:hypothetical protein